MPGCSDGKNLTILPISILVSVHLRMPSQSAIRSPANGFDFAFGNELWKIICRCRRIYGSSIQVQCELTIMLFVANFYINWWVICRSVTSSSFLSFSFSFSSSFSVFSLVAFILHFAVERGHINKLGVGSLVFFLAISLRFPYCHAVVLFKLPLTPVWPSPG